MIWNINDTLQEHYFTFEMNIHCIGILEFEENKYVQKRRKIG